jgi:hypothetical protein
MNQPTQARMTTPTLQLVDGRLLVSPTQIETIKQCFTQWRWKYLHRRVANRPSPARDGGKAMHSGLELIFKGRLAGKDEQSVMEAARTALHDGFKGIDLPEDEYRTEARYQAVLEAYVAHWKNQGEEFETLAVERPFEVPLGQIAMAHGMVPVHLRGIIDRVVAWGNVAYVADTKTMNDWGSRKQDEWERAAAPKLYAYALNQLASELKLPGTVQGFMLDAIVIRKPTTNPRAKLPREEFHRLRYPYTEAQLIETRDNALAWVQMAVDQAASGRFLMQEQSCANLWGRRCDYWEVCSVPVEQRAMVLASDYFMDKVESGKFDKAEEVTE